MENDHGTNTRLVEYSSHFTPMIEIGLIEYSNSIFYLFIYIHFYEVVTITVLCIHYGFF